MAERSSFFDSINGDRVYYAADWAAYMDKYFTSGVFNNGLQVVPHDGMNIGISIGEANVKGHSYVNDSKKIINVVNADGVLNRVDNIVIRLDLPNRKVTAEIITGTFAENATAPELTRGTSIYELRIAKISIPAGTTEITQDLITDTRFGDNDCGNVICAVQNPNFTNVLKQYEALWNKLIENQTQDFEKWFINMKGQLDGDVAANLLNLINTKADIPRRKILTLLSTNWTLNTSTNKYEYIIEDEKITEDDFADCLIYEEDKKKISDLDQHTENGRLILTTSKQVTENINMTVVLIRTIEETEVEA